MINLINNISPYINRFAATCDSATKGQVATPSGNDTCTNFDTNLPGVVANQATVTHALQIVFGIMGLIAVVYIMYSAFHFTRSQGDPQTIAKARNGIIFALLGLAIIVSAEIIVTFVLGQL